MVTVHRLEFERVRLTVWLMSPSEAGAVMVTLEPLREAL